MTGSRIQRDPLLAVKRVAAGLGAAALLAVGMGATAAAAPVASSRAVPVSVRTAAGRARAATAACPAPPSRPATSTAYKLSGYRWDPAETIDYVLDTARVPAAQQKARIADIRTAMREAAKYSGLTVKYKGTEAKLVSPTTHRQLVQFEYSYLRNDVGVNTNIYNYSGTDQLLGGTVDVRSSTTTGYGPFDVKHPLASPEGHLLLFGVGETVGLNPVKTTYRQVMNPESSKSYYYDAYQAGDRFGLWKVGASAGCTGFKY
jgi:hypothetical protein